MICNVTGKVFLHDGRLAKNYKLYLVPDEGVAPGLSGTVLPHVITVRTNNDGEVGFTVVDGRYDGYYTVGSEKFTFEFNVPNQPYADFADCLIYGDYNCSWPYWLEQALEARTVAEAASARAEQSANEAESYLEQIEAMASGAALANKWYNSIADGMASTAIGDSFGVLNGIPPDNLVRDTLFRKDSASDYTVIVDVVSGHELDVEVETRKSLIRSVVDDEDEYYGLASMDANGREVFGSWRKSDGAPTDWGKALILKRLEEDHVLPYIEGSNGYSFAVTQLDSNGVERLTDLAIREDDGQFADFVIDRIAARIGGSAGGSGGRPLPNGTWKHPSGDYVPYKIDRSVVVSLGSSSAERSRNFYRAFVEAEGVEFVNLGDGSASLETNSMMIGRTPAFVNVSGNLIPATGGVTITNSPVRNNVVELFGTIEGIYGSIKRVSGVSTFTRSVDGDSVTVSNPALFIPDTADLRNKAFVVESGKNNFNTMTAQGIANGLRDMCEWLAPFYQETLVVGYFTNQDYDTAQKDKLYLLNDLVKADFGDRFIDVQGWLTGEQIWVDLANEGYTPTSDDRADQANRLPPRGLMSDSGHLTTNGYRWRSKYLVEPKLKQLLEGTL